MTLFVVEAYVPGVPDAGGSPGTVGASAPGMDVGIGMGMRPVAEKAASVVPAVCCRDPNTRVAIRPPRPSANATP